MKTPLFLKAFNSPFKRPKLHWYFGKTALGTPYFLPRKWVKYTNNDCIKQANESMDNKRLTERSFEEWVDYYKGYSKAVPKKVGFDFIGLGFKTKWSDTDFRHEWNPRWSFVLLGYQLAVTLIPLYDCHYWECFLLYIFATDKNKSKQERIEQCIKDFPCIWNQYSGDKKEKVDYWKLILKQNK